MENRCNGFSFVCGVMLGAVLGASAAFLLAPQSGAETRAKLKDGAERLYGDAEKYVRDVSEKAPEYIGKGMEKLKETAGSVRQSWEKSRSRSSVEKADLEQMFEEKAEDACEDCKA